MSKISFAAVDHDYGFAIYRERIVGREIIRDKDPYGVWRDEDTRNAFLTELTRPRDLEEVLQDLKERDMEDTLEDDD